MLTRMENFLGYIGQKTTRSTDHYLNLFAFTYKLLSMIVKRPKAGRVLIRWAIIEQVFFTGVQALIVVIPIALIVGSMMMIQFTKLSGQVELGRMIIILIVRELGPLITALVVILRSATAVTIEIGYMNVFNEIDAFEMTGIDPMRVICLPRLVGITSAILCLFIVFDLVSIVGGYTLAWALTDIQMGNLLEQIGKAMTVSDITVGIVKAVFFGITITAVSLYRGFSVKKRITQIPMGASRSAVDCFFYVLIINIIISAIFYL